MFFPTLSTSRKKLFPTSSGLVGSDPRIVKCPIPGRTRFLSVEVEVAVEVSRRMRDDSSAD